MRIPAPLARLPHPHTLKEAVLHMALVVFGLDVLAAFWPDFNAWWSSHFHFLVALAVLLDAAANHADVFNHRLHYEVERLKAEREEVKRARA